MQTALQDSMQPPRPDPYEGLDTEQRNRAVALAAAKEVLRGVFGDATSQLAPENLIQVAEYIVTGNCWALPPTPDEEARAARWLSTPLLAETRTLSGQTHVFTGEPGEAVHHEPQYTDDQGDNR